MNASRTLATTALIVLLALAPAALADDGSAGPTLSASTSRPAAAASPRDQAMALYHSVDELLAHREFDAARADVVTFREDHPDAAAWTRSLDRELEVLGKPAPKDWSIETWFQGQSDVVLDGSRPTVVLFWEAWCPHCRHEAPRLEALYERYRERGLQVIGVTRLTHDATEQSVREFLDESGIAYPIAKETGALADYFNVKGIPAAAIVDHGEIVWRGHPIRLTDTLIDELF